MSKSFNHIRKEFAEISEKVDVTKDTSNSIDRMYAAAEKRTEYVKLKDLNFKKTARIAKQKDKE